MLRASPPALEARASRRIEPCQPAFRARVVDEKAGRPVWADADDHLLPRLQRRGQGPRVIDRMSTGQLVFDGSAALQAAIVEGRAVDRRTQKLEAGTIGQARTDDDFAAANFVTQGHGVGPIAAI